MADVPRPIAVFMCERVLQDMLRKTDITLVNIHSTMSVQQFPAVVPLVFAYSEVTGSATEFSYQFRFKDKRGQVITESNVQQVAPSPDKNISHKLIGAFSGLLFPEEGSYQLMLAINNKEVAGMEFQIIKIAAQA